MRPCPAPPLSSPGLAPGCRWEAACGRRWSPCMGSNCCLGPGAAASGSDTRQRLPAPPQRAALTALDEEIRGVYKYTGYGGRWGGVRRRGVRVSSTVGGKLGVLRANWQPLNLRLVSLKVNRRLQFFYPKNWPWHSPTHVKKTSPTEKQSQPAIYFWWNWPLISKMHPPITGALHEEPTTGWHYPICIRTKFCIQVYLMPLSQFWYR